MSLLNSTTMPTPESVASITFGWFDYVIFSLMLGLSALIGIYFGCFGSKQSTTKEYLLGGKSMKVLPIVISLVSSHISGITLLGVPADVFRYGSAYWLVVLCMAMLPFFTVYVYLPVYFNLQITSTYEYLELRFDGKTRSLASFIFAVAMFLFLPIVIYIPSLAVAAATGFDVHYITPIICGVCIFYTTIGGLKAVVWTDTLQFTITLGAVITVFILGCMVTGGFGNVWRKSVEGHRLDVFDFDLDPTKRDTFWMLAIGYTFHWLSATVANQGCVQKFLAIATLEDSKKAVWWYAFGIALLKTFSVLTGLIMYAKYADCDPFKTGEVQRNDQLLPYYVMDVAGHIPGLPGLFIAGVVSAALSTLSAHLNCMSATIYKDFLAKFMPESTTEQTASNVLKLIVLVVGIMCAALIYVVEHLGGILPLAIALSGVCAGPSLGLFTLGILVPRCNSKGAFWGAIISLVCMCWIVFASQYYTIIGALVDVEKTTSMDACPAYINITSVISTTIVPPTVVEHSQPFILYRISRYYYSLIGTVITMTAGYVISLFTKEDEKAFRLDLVSPLVHFLVPRGKKLVQDNVEYCSVDKALRIITYNSEKEKETEANASA